MSDGLQVLHGPAELLDLVRPEELGAPSRTAEVLIDGEPLRLAPEPQPCSHSETLMFSQPVVAFISSEDGASVEAREAKLNARCGDCGVTMVIELTGRRPRDGSPGIVLSLTPEA